MTDEVALQPFMGRSSPLGGSAWEKAQGACLKMFTGGQWRLARGPLGGPSQFLLRDDQERVNLSLPTHTRVRQFGHFGFIAPLRYVFILHGRLNG